MLHRCTLVWFKKVKFKLETRAPSQFVRPVNSIIEAKFQLLIPTGRRCSMTSKSCHILCQICRDPEIVSFVLSYLLTCLEVFERKCTRLPVEGHGINSLYF